MRSRYIEYMRYIEVLRQMFLQAKGTTLAREEQQQPKPSSASKTQTVIRQFWKSFLGQIGARHIAATDPFHMPIIIWSIANLKSCPKQL